MQFLSKPSVASHAAIVLMFACALSLGIACAVIFDFASPNMRQVNAVTSVSMLMPADDIASRMESQITADAPGVALAIEQTSPSDIRLHSRVLAARAHALFELGNAPDALQVTQLALLRCEQQVACTYGERSVLLRLELILSAVVSAGIVDAKQDPLRTTQAFQAMARKALLTQIQSH